MHKNKLAGKIIGLSVFCLVSLLNTNVKAQDTNKSQQEINAKASGWVASLGLNDKAKAERVTNVIATHLEAVRDWNNTHPYTSVPAGINPETGSKLSDLDRQIIVNSTIPASVHENLMNGLRKDLNEQQVDAILDKYTVGKVAFTLKGYEAIVPNLTDKEKEVILSNLKMAREQAIDYKSMKQISAIFGIYKTKNEQYLNNNGRNWHQLYKDYYNKMKAEKAAKKVK